MKVYFSLNMPWPGVAVSVGADELGVSAVLGGFGRIEVLGDLVQQEHGPPCAMRGVVSEGRERDGL
ncbi:hypothetical protein ACH47C_24115 [Streptomyces rishiriensis]|uniref:hypothetical protein n=1 Tax=Streptomyces rishiriensis TaxID=68264 RepID=UPI0033D1A63E